MADDVTILRGGYEAFARGDVPAVLGVFHPEIEWTEPEGYPWGGTSAGTRRWSGSFQKGRRAAGPGLAEAAS